MKLSIECILWFIYLTICRAFDPDEDICKDPKLDSAVNAADGKTYIFKGENYWTTKTLDNNKGIVGFGQPIGSKWSDIKTPIKAAFAIKHRGKFSDQWIAYDNKGVKVVSGLTKLWPFFTTYNINTMFSTNLLNNEIFLVYEKSSQFLIYKFDDLFSPNIIKTGGTAIYEKFLWFIDAPGEGSTNTLKDLMEVRSAISYSNYLILMSDQRYCRVDLKGLRMEKKCETDLLITNALGCPLDLTKRSTKTSETTDFSTIVTENSGYDSSSLQSTTLPNNGSNGNDTDSDQKSNNDQKKETSNLMVPIIIAVIIVIIVIVIAVIVLWLRKGSKTDSTEEKTTERKEKSTATVHTVNSNTGAPTASGPSVVSLKSQTI